MKKLYRYIIVFSVMFFSGMFLAYPKITAEYPNYNISLEYQQPDSTLRFPVQKDTGLDPFRESNSMYLKDPSNITTTVEYDPVLNQYVLKRKIGNVDYRDPYYFNLDEYRDYEMKKGVKEYWKERSATAGGDAREGLIPTINIRSEAFDRIFGSNTIDIRPQGSIDLKFGVLHNFRDDKSLDIRQRRHTSFDFDMNMQINVMAMIGEKIRLNFNMDSRNVNFKIENDNKLAYEGSEDEIIRLIEAGNVTMPINSSLIAGSQSLFGIKTKLQFGKLTITGVVAEQNSTSSNVTVSGGAQTTEFKIKASDYDENRHFFLAKYFRDNYETGLSTLPIISSNVNITKIEVWITNIGSAVTENRNIIAFSDLGENEPYNQFVYPSNGGRMPDNSSNTLMMMMDTAKIRDVNSVYTYLSTLPGADFSQGRDFEKIESARKLSSNEYTFNRYLGFISLSTALTAGQVLAVAFQYTVNDEVYQVGEFSDQGIVSPNNLVVKLLRSTTIDTKHPMWNLMMKNVYALNAYQVEEQDFMLNVLFSGNENGVATGYFKEGPNGIKGVSLLKLFGLDTLDSQKNPIAGGDGIFDFIDNASTNGGTIQASNGRVFFPVLEPFGSHLRKILPTSMANKYAYDSLYTQTKTNAKQLTEKDKFLLSGYYSSSGGAEINLNAFDVPQGSVVVTAGGRTLVENVDYTVDYIFGRVTIINDGILNSGATINVSTESQAGMGYKKQSLMGVRADYLFSQHLNFGATFMHLREKPNQTKVSYGDEPIANSIWGMDIQFQKEVPFITKMIDFLPLISTRAPSMVSASAEFAQFIPGHPNVIGESGNSFIDDFESSKQSISLVSPHFWFLASTPSYFPEANSGDLSYGFRRAKLAWYVIDPMFYQSGFMPPNIKLIEASNHYVRRVEQKELFPKAEAANDQPVTLTVLNLAYYPTERGPYNYNVDELKDDGTLENPEDKWGGIMRKMETTDFEANNIEYIEFWLLDPFIDPDDEGPQEPFNTKGGKLVFNLGDISEDILKDGRKSFENGLPINDNVTGVDTTIWGRVPSMQALVYAFDNDPASRAYQDVGYDGLNSTRANNNDEYTFFYDTYIAKISEKFGGTNSIAYQNAVQDPSADDFQYFRGSHLDDDDAFASILMRYKNYNGPEGNSCPQEYSPESYDISSTTLPNIEDINNDNTLSESENFYEYIVNLDPNRMVIGENYITDIYEAKNVQLQNGNKSNATWYQFKVPISQPDMVHGVISDLTSVRFMRMYLTEFEEPVVLRFASLELVKGDWRRFSGDLLVPGEYIPNNSVNQTNFDVFTVSLEENGGTTDRVPYVMPRGVRRERDLSTTNYAQQNEQSMAMTVTNLFDGDARGTYKTAGFDFRNYQNLEMYIHAHAETESDNAKYANTTGAISVFIRFGPDLTENYYEYEIPITVTPWGTTAGNIDLIWMEQNMMNVDFEKLTNAKKERTKAMEDDPAMSTIYPYTVADGNNKITILGTPTMSTVNAIMIGIKNPKQTNSSVNDDGMPISMTVWINELRLTNFNEKSGWAATANLSANLADFGNIAVSGLYSTPGFGNINTKVSERSQETVFNIYTSVNLELGKIFPETSGIRVPVHFDYSEEIATPEYDPMNPDIYMKDQLALIDDREERAEYRTKVQDITKKTNVNVMNVRKDRTSANTKKPHFWDVENFDVSYSYSKTQQSNIDIEYNDKIIHTAGLGYSFNANPKNVKPFAKVKFMKNKNWAFIKDFNFYYQPRSFVFRTNMDKTYIERLIRNKTGDDIIINPTVSKQWNWNRNYVFKHDFATSLKFDYAANAMSFIDEPAGLITDRDAYKQEVWSSVKKFGRMNTFNQTAGLNWTVPINKIPLLGWINLTAKYDATLRWNASALSVQEQMGNTIENSANINISSNFRLSTLYNSIPYVKNAVKTTPKRPQQPAKPKQAAENDTIQKEKPKVNYAKIIGDGIIKIIFGVKDVSISYQNNGGTLLPGFKPEPNNFGYNWKSNAPTWGFILGSQQDIRQKAGANGWITTDTLMNNRYSQTNSVNINYRANYEPFSGFKIEFTGSYRSSENYSELYKADAFGNFGETGYAPMYGGSYQVSYIFIKSAFTKSKIIKGEGADDRTESNLSPTFELMKEYRNTIAYRYANENGNWDRNSFVDSLSGNSYPVGYGPSQQEVVLSALIAAYAGVDPNKVALTSFPRFPLPNWNIQFNGLSKIEALKPYFRNISIKHTYRGMYNVGSYSNNVYYEENNGFASAYDDANNFIASKEISVIQITEQFAPLIGLEFTMQNSLMANVQIRKTRTLGMSFANNQLTDNSSDEYVFGVGYRFKDVKFTVRSLGGKGKKTNLNSDINIKLDFSIRNNLTVLRRLDEELNQISSGQKIYSINFTADYMVSKNLTIMLYHEQTINKPYMVNSIPNSTFRSGVSLRMTLAQ